MEVCRQGRRGAASRVKRGRMRCPFAPEQPGVGVKFALKTFDPAAALIEAVWNDRPVASTQAAYDATNDRLASATLTNEPKIIVDAVAAFGSGHSGPR